MTMRLSATASRRYWRALMANAVSLVDDAAVLLGHGSAGRARALLILAEEELARAQALYNSSVSAWEGHASEVEVPPRSHLAQSRDHREKISAADAYGQGLGPFWGDYSAWAEGSGGIPGRDPAIVNQTKQDGFYVASTADSQGQFGSPLDAPAEPVATELERVAGVVEMAVIEDHTRKQALGTAQDADSVQDLHAIVLEHAHPEFCADFIRAMEERADYADPDES
ncbi:MULTISPECIES: AbiV family abortive infection protein [unclassified Mycobacteroides]|uniref:AbiV family abortive infection protein n=1 Tax=unclassified Mycobacteroides TaxID=2618759 RepID=UPI001412C82E|nr:MULTISPECIES: AbiV family abortive infection protein [unclassified Mycobacteroides]